jgi:hypothetical protein
VATYGDDLWIPLVDEPIGTLVEEIVSENPEIAQLVDSPRRLLAFRTFAYIRVGILLGSLLVDRDVDSDAAASWAERLLREPDVHEQVTAEILAIAEEIAADPAYEDDPPLGPDDAERARFRDFAKRRLATDA